MEKSEALAPLFYRELEKIIANQALTEEGRLEATHQLLLAAFQEITQRERLQFTTHFARIAYAGHKYRLDKSLLYYIHQFRHLARRKQRHLEPVLSLGYKVVAETILGLWKQPLPSTLADVLPLAWPLDLKPTPIKGFRPRVRVLALEDDAEHEQLLVRHDEQPEAIIRVQYNLPERNELFNPTIEVIRKVTGFPVTLNLLDVEIDEAGVYRPRAFVVEPDYLVDVSAVADCYHGSGVDPWCYLTKKFLPFTYSLPLMVGHLANFFLDELMTNPEAEFADLKSRLFALNPLAFCCFDDRQIRELLQQSQRHFVHLKQIVAGGLAQERINPADCYLEPTFYSERYGLQGRLDLFHRAVGAEGRTAIVELKSGKPFMPNIHGISPNHFIQTLLYDLLVRSAYGAEADAACYILYSGEDDRHLRFAPPVKAQQYEAVQVRNQLVAIEFLLGQIGCQEGSLVTQGDRLFGRLRPEKFPHLRGYTLRDLQAFADIYQQLDTLERTYFAAFAGFVAREHQLAKTGVQGMDNLNGLASLWLDSIEDKEQHFQRLAWLQLVVNHASKEEAALTFLRTDKTNTLANFRVGDIAVLYPADDEAGVLSGQIFKCTITELSAELVIVRLRSRQFNDRIFQEIPQWHIEHDVLDSSFVAYYRGLFEFAAQPAERRRRLLGLLPPGRPKTVAELQTPGLTAEQQQIFNRILAAPDYFLLWGPPGTGKTSLMLHHLVRHLLENTDESLLLLAYTNRAVDEICESIERIGPQLRGQYLRIGSRYATAPVYRETLLQLQLEGTQSRSELLALLKERRIVVGTVASLAGKPELLELKKFSRLIVDEASQILEPLLIGLLARFDRWLLIGDHRQLPAVVAQRDDLAAVDDELLNGIGLRHLGQSLFERLFLRCQQQGWDWAYARLSHQGRMHRDIMTFPSRHFYQGGLHILPQEVTDHLRQLMELQLSPPADAGPLDRLISRRRLVFLPTDTDAASVTLKTNLHEARLVAELIAALLRLYKVEGQAALSRSIGIITPYRAQIAQIRQELLKAGYDPARFTIDTVERYQGGARDIIIISLCTNSARQLQSLSSLSTEGVDRKLNVAMTRAREHLIILGNPALLQTSDIYRRLLEHCYSEGAWAEVMQ